MSGILCRNQSSDAELGFCSKRKNQSTEEKKKCRVKKNCGFERMVKKQVSTIYRTLSSQSVRNPVRNVS